MRLPHSLSILSLLLAAGAALAQAERPEVPRHADPLVQGVQDHLNRLCDRHDARLAAIETPEQLGFEVSRARRKFLALLDLDLEKPRKTPPVRRVGVLDFPEYRIEKLVVETERGVPVPCNLYVPRGGGASPRPALLAPHGHSGRDRPVYQNGYQRLAKAGFVVLAKDGWGKQERRGTGHGAEGGQLFLSGGSLLALELWDNVRLVDYLASRPDVDRERLGMVGLSGGGTQTLYTMAIDPRLKAGSPTCAVTTFRSDLADTTMCVCELSADLLTLGDHGLFLTMAFPRPLLVVNGIQDAIFPIAGARASTRQARKLYAVGGHEERMRFAEFDTGHDWSDPMLTLQIGWFRQQLGLPPIAEPALGDGPVDAASLGCFPDGELPKNSLTLTALNRRRMNQSDPAPAPVAEMIRSRWSGAPSLPTNLVARDLGLDTRRLFRRRQLTWTSALGGPITARVTQPPAGPSLKPKVVVRLDRDRQVPQIEELYWDDQIRTAATVVDFEYTGKRLTPVQEGQVGTALLTSGRSLLAERARDLLVLLQALEKQSL
ncbi:MAG: alpha/beta hydrolase family protein, partial [Actinomycetota bacterium]